jgi:hypothetical protein
VKHFVAAQSIKNKDGTSKLQNYTLINLCPSFEGSKYSRDELFALISHIIVSMSSSEQGTAKLPAALDSLECRDSLSNIDLRTSGQSLLMRRIDQTVKHRHALIIEHPFSVADDSKEGRT